MWWVLTSQDTLPLHDSLTVIATTDKADNLFICWHYYKPARVPIYRTVRGRKVLCGYKYTWYKPHIVRQTQPGDTIQHNWHLPDLIPDTTIWFYLYAPGGPYGLQIQGPLTSAVLPHLRNWVKHVYVGTRSQGVYYTENFVIDKKSPQGVPTWIPVNAGLDPPGTCLGFTGDPFDPSNRQYFLNATALHRRTTGDWIPILPRADIIDYTGCMDVPASRFPHNGIAVNTNQPGWISVTFLGRHDTNGVYQYRHYFCLSLDYGATWTLYLAEDGTLNAEGPVCLTIGQAKGTSPYPPGRVIYFMARKGWWAYCLRSIDGGNTWDSFLIGPALWRDASFMSEGHMTVDPTTQDTCYFTGCYNPFGEYYIKYSRDHGVTWADYDGAAFQPLGARQCFLALNLTLTNVIRVGTDRDRLLFYKTTDGGASWTSTEPPLPSVHLHLSTVHGRPDHLYVTDYWLDGTVWPNCIWVSEDEGATFINKSGANSGTPITGGGDSLPFTCDGIRGILQILTI